MASEGNLQLEIVTPQGMVLSERVDEVQAPSVNGEFGVLAGHLPMLAALNIGLLHYTEGNKTTHVAVGSGFAEIINNKALVLTDRFITKEEVRDGDHILGVRSRLKEVDAELEKWTGDLQDLHRLSLIEEECWLAAQLELYGDPPVAKVLETSRSMDYSQVIPELEAAPEVDNSDD
jgi:F-type H+-transporting ATPase subunit epsilon